MGNLNDHEVGELRKYCNVKNVTIDSYRAYRRIWKFEPSRVIFCKSYSRHQMDQLSLSFHSPHAIWNV